MWVVAGVLWVFTIRPIHIEIGQLTWDVRHIEARNNQMADFLSRSDTIGKSHLLPDKLDIEALEEVSLRTLEPKALADSQAICPEVKSHKEGNHPKSVKLDTVKIGGYDLLCEVSQNPRPMVPAELRPIIAQTFHALGHPNPKETCRRISEF